METQRPSAAAAAAGARERIARLRQAYLAQLPERVAQARALCDSLAGAQAGSEAAAHLHRLLHNLKGTGRSFGLTELGACAERGEDLLLPLVDGAPDGTAGGALQALPADAIAKYRFVPGQRFAAKIILLREPDALSVSNVAVEQQDGKHWVQVRDGRGFTRREVQLGVRGTARSQVVSGLDAGDEVLLSAGGVELPLKPVDGDATPPGDATAAGESAP